MTRRKKSVVATGVALAALMAGVAAAFVISRGTGTADAAEVRPSSMTEPAFTPGIPGLKSEDVRDHKALWRQFDDLQRSEQSDRISIAEYRSKAIEQTADFLELRGAASNEFAAAASGAVTTIRESFLKWRQANGDGTVEEARFRSDMQEAVTRVTALLQNEPRHKLFATQCKEWLLRLAFGPTEPKEAKQAKRAKRT
jgi:hypothetical protein